ncbi:hypothetical protein [Streptomyces mirabilis]
MPDGPGTAARRREFTVLLGEFRRTPVLVPLGELKELGMAGARRRR